MIDLSLGLAITKMLVDKMNGIIYFKGVNVIGSKFTVELPVYSNNSNLIELLTEKETV